MKQSILFFLATLAMFGGTACVKVHEAIQGTHETVTTGHSGGAYTTVNPGRYDLENREQIVLLSKGVERSVTCPGIQQRVRDDGRLEVIASLRNREERRIQLQVNCVFKDDNGIAIEDETPFQTVILSENAQEPVRFVSMNNRARKYTVRVREAR